MMILAKTHIKVLQNFILAALAPELPATLQSRLGRSDEPKHIRSYEHKHSKDSRRPWIEVVAFEYGFLICL